MKILVVDDEPGLRQTVSRILGAEGHSVGTAGEGEEALSKLSTEDVDLVLCDLRMPKMDGFELLQHCQTLPQSHRPTRVIAISGEYEASALHGQPVQFLPKPFDMNVLLDMLGGKPN